jgi:hypothetical protein
MTSTRPPAERAPPVLSRKRSSSAPTTRTPACSTSCAFSATPISTFSSPPVAPPTTTTSTTSSFCAKVHRTRPRAAAVFDAAVGVLLNTTADYAATSPMRFGTGVHLDTPTIFSLVQCVPSLTLAKCGRCLAYVVGNIGASCSGARSCMVCRLSCGFVHQQSRFYSAVCWSTRHPQWLPRPQFPRRLPPAIKKVINPLHASICPCIRCR